MAPPPSSAGSPASLPPSGDHHCLGLSSRCHTQCQRPSAMEKASGCLRHVYRAYHRLGLSPWRHTQCPRPPANLKASSHIAD
eukprot:scaffold7129_cov19-Tisochrysis_lutea.AAC.1